MGRKRRQLGIDDQSAWIFNRMADVYDARPAYPTALVDAVAALTRGRRVLDLGAGTGHFALRLAERGLQVVCVEPALAMLQVLRARARAGSIELTALQARAEELPFEAGRFDLVLISDALHFLDAELTAREICRVLVPGGALALVICEFGNTPFMKAVRRLMDDAAPRRPRATEPAIRQIATLSRVRLTQSTVFQDEVLVDPTRLEQIARSVSFIGPALNETRFEVFRGRLHALPGPARWARTFTLRAGRRDRRAWCLP